MIAGKVLEGRPKFGNHGPTLMAEVTPPDRSRPMEIGSNHFGNQTLSREIGTNVEGNASGKRRDFHQEERENPERK